MLDSFRGSDMPVGRAIGGGCVFGQWLVLSPALESSTGHLGVVNLADSDGGGCVPISWGDIRIALARELHCSQLPVRYSPLAGSRWVETAAGLS